MGINRENNIMKTIKTTGLTVALSLAFAVALSVVLPVGVQTAEASGEACRISGGINLNPTGNEYIMSSSPLWQTPVSVNLAPGTYRVWLHGHDDRQHGGQGQTQEQFNVRLRNSGGTQIGQTGNSGDIPESSTYWSGEISQRLTINQRATTMYAHHAFPGAANSQSLTAVCAKFVAISTTQPPTVDIKANGSNGPVRIAPGGATLSWTSTNNPTTCSTSGHWGGNRPNSGSIPLTLNVPQSYTYNITCSNSAGSDSDSVTIIVEQQVQPPTVDIKASAPGQSPSDGPITIAPGAATLTWNSTNNPDTCSASGRWGGSRPTSGNQPLTLNVAETYTYTITCQNAAGSDSDSVTIIVEQPVGAPSVDIQANGSQGPVTVGREQFRLHWSNNSDTTSCEASGSWGGTKVVNSQEFRGPLNPGTYTYNLTCRNSLGQTVNDSVTVIVQEDAAPSVDIRANDQNGPITVGNEQFRLSWSNNSATTACTAFNGWSGPKNVNSQEFRGPLSAGTYTYTLVCRNAAGVTVSDSVTVIVQPQVGDPSVDIQANGSQGPITVGSEQFRLSWTNNSNTTSCTASGAWNGTKLVNSQEFRGPLSPGSYTYNITCRNSAGATATDSVTVIVEQIVGAPSVDIKANGSDGPITVGSEQFTLNWSNNSNTTSCTASGAWSGTKNVNTQESRGPLASGTYTYTLTCRNSAGQTATDSVSVTVGQIGGPSVDIRANDQNGPITVGSEQFRLSWTNNSNTTSCTASNSWSGTKLVNSQEFRGPLSAGTYTYTLTCRNSAGATASDSVTVIVQQAAGAPSVDIKANGSDGPITVGNEQFTLNWTNNSNTTSCTASGAWNGTKNVNTQESRGPLSNGAYVYSLTCRNSAGQTATDSVTVNVNQAADVEVDIKANGSDGPITINENTQAELSWTSSNATNCFADGGPGSWSGAKVRNGREFTSRLSRSFVYTITCVGNGGATDSDSVTINVDQTPDAPTVVLTADPTTIDEGAQSVLTWVSTNATNCFATGGPWTGTKVLNGSEATNSLNNTRTFSITCVNSLGQSASDTATVTVTDLPDVPTVTLSASPENVDSGVQSRLTWVSNNATNCQASGGPWNGVKALSGSEFTQPLTTTVVFSITCVNSLGQSASDTATVTVNDIVAPPTVVLTADPTTVGEGGTSILNWVSTNATSCLASGGPINLWNGPKLVSSSEAVSPLTQTTTFTITCIGPGGQASDTAIVVVNASPDAPTVDITATPIVINEGDQATLSWTSTNANSCFASGGPWSGAKTTGSTEVVGPLSITSTYTITCQNSVGQSATDSATVTVIDSPDLPTVTLTANPTTVDEGASTILTWTSTNVTSCQASGGPINIWTGTKAPNANEIVGPLLLDTTFTITCVSPTGQTVSDTASVIVTQLADNPFVSISASPIVVPSGTQTMLTWNSTNTSNCRANGGPWTGPKALNGSEFTQPLSQTTSFTITCENSAGTEVSATVTVSVTTQNNPPTVNISANPSNVNSGGTSTLTWNSTNATNCFASGGNWSGTKALNASEAVSNLTQTTTYSITCTNASGQSATDSTTVTVNGGGGGNVTVNLTANPNNVQSNTQSTLTWTSSNATSCFASGGPWSGTKVRNGNEATQALTQTTTYSITCTGSDGSTASDSATITVNGGGNAPTVNLNSNPSFVNNGANTTLTWNSNNANSCFASGGPWSGTKGTNGNQTVGPLFNTTTFTITCTGNSGQQVSDSTTVTVGNGGGGNPPYVNISASPNPVPTGTQTQLFWNSSNADQCYATGGPWTGPKLRNGSEFRQIVAPTTFTITCTGNNGQQAIDSVTVTPIGGGGGGIPSVILTASPTIIAPGQSSVLSWTANNVTSCNASGNWTGPRAISGNLSTGPLSVSQSYIINCIGVNGQPVQSQATVTVNGGGGGLTFPPTLNFFATPSTVNSGGTSNLNWTTTNATSCNATGSWSGIKPVNGTQTTGALTLSQNYIMTCTGPGGSVTRNAPVTVGQVLGATTPTLSIYANPSPVNYNTQTTISWTSTGTDTCYASGDWTGPKLRSGSEVSRALVRDSDFTLTCSGIGGTITRTATVPVVGGPIVVVTPPTGGEPGTYNADITKLVTNLSVANGTDQNISAWAGNTLQYTITVRNTGSLTLRNLTVTDRLAEELVDVKTISDDGKYDLETRTVTWKIPSLAAGESKVFTLTVTVHECKCADAVAVPNTATLSGANITDVSSNVTTAGVQAYPFIIDITNNSSVVAPGDTVNYTVNYRNDGSRTLTDARLDVFLPAGMSIEGHSKNCTISGNTVGLDIGSIAPGEADVINIIAKVDEGVLNGEQLTTRVVIDYRDSAGGTPKEASALTVSTVSRGDNPSGSAVASANSANDSSRTFRFLPHTFWGWLILLLLIIIIAIFIRRLLAKE